MAAPNNIERLRKAKGWMRPQLAERMSTSPQQVERLEKGQRKLNQEWIERAAEALGVDLVDIICDPDELEERLEARAGLPAVHVPVIPAQRRLPPSEGAVALRQVDLALSMGDGANIDDYADEGTFEFDAGLLRSITRSPPERLFVARGAGDSMFPTLVDGDMVVIDTMQRMLNLQDRIWAISLFGAGGLKRLRAIARDRVEVISDNIAHTNQEVGVEDLRIMGRVIWIGRRV